MALRGRSTAAPEETTPMMRLTTVALVATLVLVGATLDTRAQSDAPPIKIGYAISRTGPFAPGAQATQEPSHILWAEQVNAAGGIEAGPRGLPRPLASGPSLL